MFVGKFEWFIAGFDTFDALCEMFPSLFGYLFASLAALSICSFLMIASLACKVLGERRGVMGWLGAI